MYELRRSMQKYDPGKWARYRDIHRARRFSNKYGSVADVDLPEGTEFVVVTQDDDCPDLSYLGEFSERWQPYAINHKRSRGKYDRYAWPFYYPAYPAEDHARDLRKLGYSKQVAAEIAAECQAHDYKRTCTYGDDWCTVFLAVKLVINGRTVTQAMVGGIESDSGDDYMEEMANDLKWECLDDLAPCYESMRDVADIMEELIEEFGK